MISHKYYHSKEKYYKKYFPEKSMNPLTRFHSRWPPTPVSALAALSPLTCSPGPCWHLQPRASSPFRFPWRYSRTPVSPCGFALLGSVLLPPFLEPLLPPAGINLRPGPCWSWGGLCLHFLASFPPPPCFLLTRSCSAPSLGIFCFFLSSGRPFER